MRYDGIETSVFTSFDDLTLGTTKVGAEDDVGFLGEEVFCSWDDGS